MKKTLYLSIILFVFILSACDKISTSPTYICETTDLECFNDYRERKENCTNSINILDSPTNTFKDQLLKKEDYCLYRREITQSSLPDVKGVKLKCEIPLNKLKMFGEATDEMVYFKYCEGTYKNKLYELTGKIIKYD